MIEVAQVLTIAGIDSSGGAGANADLKTFHNQKVYGASVITGLTAQNTLGVQEVLPTPADFILAQFDSVLTDLDIKAAKTGALFAKAQVEAVIEGIQKYQIKQLVVDPVMVAKGGAKLLTDDAIDLVKTGLIPLANLLTPNLEEAALLVGYSLEEDRQIRQALFELQEMGAQNILIKGGHSKGQEVRDFLLTADGQVTDYVSRRIETVRTHGTGDTLSSYIVAHLARGEELLEILPQAKAFISAAIEQTIKVGRGHGPLNHWV